MTSCMHESFRRQSGACICYVLHVYVYVSKGALLGLQNHSEMGPMRGSKSLAFWGRVAPFRSGGGGGGGGGGAQIAPTEVQESS